MEDLNIHFDIKGLDRQTCKIVGVVKYINENESYASYFFKKNTYYPIISYSGDYFWNFLLVDNNFNLATPFCGTSTGLESLINRIKGEDPCDSFEFRTDIESICQHVWSVENFLVELL